MDFLWWLVKRVVYSLYLVWYIFLGGWMCFPAEEEDEVLTSEEQGNLDAFWSVHGRYQRDLLRQVGPVREEYCWMHYPGGWVCPECEVADAVARSVEGEGIE
jgi:rubredoxin